MKTRVIKLLAVLLSVMMLFSVAVLPLSAADEAVGGTTDTETGNESGNETGNETDTETAKAPHELTGNELLKYFGLDCKSEDADDGSNPDISTAAIKSANNNAYLEIKFGESGSYPIIYLEDAPTDMTNYTVSIDVIILPTTESNKLFNVLYGTTVNDANAAKNAEFGFRPGDYVEDKTQGEIKASNLAAIATKTLYVGQGILASSTTTAGTVHTLEMTVSATAMKEIPTVTLKFDGVTLAPTAPTTVLTSSHIAFSGYKLASYGVDNIKVTNNTTGEEVVNITFENEHTYGDTIEAVDETNHGFVCPCGVAVTQEHTWDEGVEIDDENSCTTKKSTKRTCTACEYERVFANAHTPGDLVTVLDTCTEDGYTSITCTTCNEVLEYTVLENDGHDYGMWSKIDGGMQRTCSACGDVETKMDEKETESKATEKETEPTAQTSTTTTTDEKKGCGAVVVSSLIPAVLVGGALLLVKKKKED